MREAEVPGQFGRRGEEGGGSLRDPISVEKSWARWHESVIPAMAGSLK
jgi:hypothetical protein